MATAFDIIILAITVVLLVSGAIHGLVRSVCRFVALLAGFIVSWMYCRDLQAWFVSSTSSSDGNSAFLTAFLIIFVVVSTVVLLLGHLLVKILDKLELGWIDRLGGAALGLLKAGIVMWAACLSISSLPGPVFEAKFGGSAVFKVYEAMPKFFSLDSMEGWRDKVRGIKGGGKEAENANGKPSGGNKGGKSGPAESGGNTGEDFDSPLKKNLREKNKDKTADI
ncbi:MAG: CvpA family protein [Chitinispirillia bacterium]|nr:CvpA family protein [Chitinispirillia bacterium]